MKNNHRQPCMDFKARVATEARKGEETITELVIRFEVYPTQINKWKKELVAGVANNCGADSNKQLNYEKRLINRLYHQIGQAKVVERDLLEKGLERWT